jgi:hypothetical protein
VPISISHYLNIDPEVFTETGAFDAILDVDSLLFIDPHLLQETEAPELKGSYEKLRGHFRGILKLLTHTQAKQDSFWRQAQRLMTFGEIKGLCIGYAKSGTSGSGWGPALRERVLDTAKAIVDAGITDPEIFELMPVLEEKVGPDRISDMVSHVIFEDLLAYAERIFSNFGVPTQPVRYGSRDYQLPLNHYNQAPILLLPRDILNDLPIARSWDDIDVICAHNRELRQRVNDIIGDTWKKATREKKDILKRTLLKEPELISDLIELYRKKPATTYDFDSDPAGEFMWYPAAVRYVRECPLTLHLPSQPTGEDVQAVVLEICGHFKRLVEANQASMLLYNDRTGKPKRESAAQKLFYCIADCCCRASNLDLTAESNGGRGPVDFKVSGGYTSRVIVEVKLSTNPNVLHGFQVQTPEYSKAEQAAHSLLLVIDVGGSLQRLEDLRELVKNAKATNRKVPDVIFVDGTRKVSASKYRPGESGDAHLTLQRAKPTR